MESVTSFKCGFVNNIGSRIVRELVGMRITSPDRNDPLSLATSYKNGSQDSRT